MVLNGVSNNVRPSAIRTSSQPELRATGQAHRVAQVAFGSNAIKNGDALTFKEKVLRWHDKARVWLERKLDVVEKARAPLAKEIQDPKSRNYLISGYVATAVTPVLLLASAVAPVAAPALWPLAGLTALWSGVILWESFNIMRGPFRPKPATPAPAAPQPVASKGDETASAK